MTDDLIARLSDDLKPVAPAALLGRVAGFVLAGLLVSGFLMLIWLGLRPDFAEAVGTSVFWIKFGYTLLLGLVGLRAVERLGRPGASARSTLFGAIAIAAVLAVVAVAAYAGAPAEARHAMVVGSSALLCPFYIVALSLPFLVAGGALMRRLAPTNLWLAGAAVGFMAGALGAWVYSFHCTEEGLPFLAIWYSLGILVMAGIGTLLGRTWLRW